jgi:hypothetical protein
MSQIQQSILPTEKPKARGPDLIGVVPQLAGGRGIGKIFSVMEAAICMPHSLPWQGVLSCKLQQALAAGKHVAFALNLTSSLRSQE